MKNREEKSSNLGIGVGSRASQCAPKRALNLQPWGAAPASAPHTRL
ncbi:hypothetical protein MTR67_041296 [Solanum verrucosum]|uniref:Uncharacterized protein n=1 Tax=Solanum verrucosum TaxID=315347 RepID=A0AAF0ZQN5_SOLVR|nr:hypothetical protein MTR67_041296 [Solanum verrucosum]